MQPVPDLHSLSHSEKDELIRTLHARVQALGAAIEELKGRLALNSSNSGKPPSSNGFKKIKKSRSLRGKSTKKPGGQDGHEGTTLQQVAEPDAVVPHLPPSHCDCGLPLDKPNKVESRQVFNIPPIKPVVTEHQAYESCCRCGAVYRGQFPEYVTGAVQYGGSVKAAVVQFTHHEMLPLARTGKLMGSLFGLPLSDATVIAIQKAAVQHFEPVVDRIKEALKHVPALHVDETGMSVSTKNKWLHIAATENLTWIGAHDKRGKIAFDDLGLLGEAKGVLIHDGLPAYRQFDTALHALCNQHHLRELLFVAEDMQQGWAKDMMALLRKACHEVNESPGNTLNPERLAYFRLVYDLLLQGGQATNPEHPKLKGQRGKAKQSKAFNLLLRLKTYDEDVWRFASDPNVPFTNNIAEHAVRMNKVKQKISGGFRTMQGLKDFCIIRSYLATLQKQGANIFEALVQAFRGNVLVPDFV